MSKLKRSDALSRVRNVLRDTVTTYNWTDALLYELMDQTLVEIGDAIRGVDPDYYLTQRTVRGYTDALDPSTDNYEFYPLPDDLAGVLRIERSDLTGNPILWQIEPARIEGFRFAGGRVNGTVTDEDGNITTLGGSFYGGVTVHGDRFRVLPAPTAAGPTYRVWYYRQIRVPQGTSEYLDLPKSFEGALIFRTAARAQRLDGSALADEYDQQFAADMQRALRAQSDRPRNLRLMMPAW